MGVELLEVRDFLAQHAPFDMLPPGALDPVPRQCTLRYARRGTVVLDVGERGSGLYVVRSGAVDVVDEAGGLVERVGTGVAFGMSSLLEGRATRYRCTASEDTLLLVLPPELFEALAREHAGFASFFAATHHDRLSKAIGNLQQAASGSTVLGTPVQGPGDPRAGGHWAGRHDRGGRSRHVAGWRLEHPCGRRGRPHRHRDRPRPA